MGNLERPLTWGLGILFILGLFIVNCECDESTTCTLNKTFNISSSELNADALEIDVAEATVEITVEDTTVVIEDSDDGTGVPPPPPPVE